MNNNNWISWSEADDQMGNGPTTGANTSPTSDPTLGATGGQPPMPNGNPDKQQTQRQEEEPGEQDDVTNDPQNADMPEENDDQDFEQWKNEFFKLSIKGNTNEMLSSIQQIRDMDLESSQRRFVEDNLAILLYRQDSNVTSATKEIRKLVKQDLDMTNPGTTIMQHMTATLEKQGLLQQILIKMGGFGGMKNDLHRKFVCSLLGAVLVGGGNKHRGDMMFWEEDYSIGISTRVVSQFGEINLGAWSLKENDPELYLTEPELDRLQEGSPEEKQVLRRRVHMESIAKEFEERAFLIHCVHTDGTVYALGWDMGSSIKDAYRNGKLVLRGKKNEAKDAMISDTGNIIRLVDVEILFVKETGEMDDNGKPEMVEVPFMERRDSILYLTADIPTMQDAASSLSGMFLREMPYPGNPSEIPILQRCIPDLSQMLNQRCVGVGVPTKPEKRDFNNPMG